MGKGLSTILHSLNAREGAERLVNKLINHELMMDILPNSYEQYNGELEQSNFVSYCNFLKSRNGRIVLDMLDKEDDCCIGETK